jgi:segregation and condensation protein B
LLTAREEPLAAEAPQRASDAQKMQAVEAVLLVARDSLSSRKLAQVAGLADATEARTLVRLLNHRYDSRGRVFRIEEVAGGFCLLTRPQFAPWLRRMRHVPGELRLTQSAMETLAIVAYRQPVPRADIEAIRGVSCGEILKQLMQRDLVRISGRSEDLGRPYLYGTTRFFLQMFGLRSADRLPRSEWINGSSGIEPLVNVNDSLSESSSDQDSGTGKDAKESTVKQSFSVVTLLQDSADEVDNFLLDAQQLRAVDEDDDDEGFEDDDEDEDFEDEDEDFEDEDEDFEDEDEEAEEDLEEEDLEDEEGDWEEVDDEDEGDEEEDEWDDEEDEDWDEESDDDDEDEDEDWD